MNDFEKIFQQEIREKKLIARSSKNKVSTNPRKCSKVMMPSDLLTGAEKRKYTKSGKVVTYKMSDMFITYDEFLNLDLDKRKEYLENFLKRCNGSKAEVARRWKVSSGTVCYHCKKLGLESRGETEMAENKRNKNSGKIYELVLKGQYAGSEIKDYLAGLDLTIKPDKNYEIEFRVKEVFE